MKKLASILFLLLGILFIVIVITSDDTNIWLPLGCAFITFGIVFRKKVCLKKIIKKFNQKRMKTTNLKSNAFL